MIRDDLHFGFSTTSNAVYLLIPFALQRPFGGFDLLIVVTSVLLALGSGLYHLQAARRHTVGHKADELTMIALLLAVNAFALHSIGLDVAARTVGISILPVVLIALPFLESDTLLLQARVYTTILSIPVLIIGFAVAEWQIVVPTALLVIGVVVRGTDDNAARHGGWHLFATATVMSSLLILQGVRVLQIVLMGL